jgi:hypothetical protein
MTKTTAKIHGGYALTGFKQDGYHDSLRFRATPTAGRTCTSSGTSRTRPL